MTTILSIDPGTDKSAWVLYDPDSEAIEKFAKDPNVDALAVVRSALYDHLVVEQIRSYGMPVGQEVFDTVMWVGRFIEAADMPFTLLPRREVKLNLCGSSKAKDANVRQALIDRYGGRDTAIGRKAAPGPLYGVSGDVWAALGVAVTWGDLEAEKRAGR